MCLKYPGSRWLMGRAVLKSLKESTLLTFWSICNEWGIKKDVHYKYNSTEGSITFTNGSAVYLKDLFLQPSDPEFDSLGSTEYTGAFIDECSQVTLKAKNIVMSRLRYKLEEFGLIPKMLLASNPSKNFLYYDYYKPWKEDTLPKFRKFIPALVQDNPFISPHYIENLKKLDETSKQRLLYGNFEYDDDPSALIMYDKIVNMFSLKPVDDKKYLTVDVARSGRDKTVFCFWQGLYVYKIISWQTNTTKDIRLKIEEVCQQENISKDKVIVDEDGVGGGVVDETEGINGFINNSKQVEDKNDYTPNYNYANLKSQCYFLLAKFINEGKIGIYPEIETDVKESLIEELEQVKRKDIDKDGRVAVVPKDKVKELLGRSPDFSDSMMMRMWFEINYKEVSFFWG